MLIELLTAFGFVFLAEMGDKTQILAMAFATKYKIKNVLIGIAIGSFLNHALAVLLGYSLNSMLPLDLLGIIAGFSFVVFGLWNLKMTTDEDTSKTSKYGPILTVSLAFFIGELGDKTQLTAIALAAESNYPILILLGTVSAMIVAGVIGIIAGLKLGSKVPDFYIKISASAIFFIFGFLKLGNNLSDTYLTFGYGIPFIAIITIMAYMLLKPTLQLRRQGLQSPYQQTAARLKSFYNKIEDKVEDLCLGLSVCGVCDVTTCIVSITKKQLSNAQNNLPIDPTSLNKKLIIKDYDKSKVYDCLKVTVDFLKDDPTNEQYKALHEIRMNFEMILFNIKIESYISYDEYLESLAQIDKNAYKKIV